MADPTAEGRIGGDAAEKRKAPGATAPTAFEQLLLQLNLDSGWLGMLLRSLQGAMDAAGESNGADANAAGGEAAGTASVDLPSAAQQAALLAQGGKGEEALAAIECPPDSPRIPACRASCIDSATVAVEAPARVEPPAVGTMQAVVRRNRQLAAAAGVAASTVPAAPAASNWQPGECRAGGAATAAPVSAPPAADALLLAAEHAAWKDAEEVVGPLECRRHGSIDSSSGGIEAGAAAAPAADGALPQEPQASKIASTLFSSWDDSGTRICDHSDSGAAGGGGGGNHSEGVLPSAEPSSSYGGSEEYDDDFEEESESAG